MSYGTVFKVTLYDMVYRADRAPNDIFNDNFPLLNRMLSDTIPCSM